MESQQIINFFSAFLTPLIAITMVYIAYQQWQTNKLKLRKDLYEQRLSIYKSTIELVYTVISLRYANNDQIIKYARGTSNNVFLFGDEINEYLLKINKKALRLKHASESIQRLSNKVDRDTKRIEEQATVENEIFSWFSNQPENVEKMFKKYLDLSNK